MADIIRTVYNEYAASARREDFSVEPTPRQVQLGRLVGSDKRVLDLGCSVGNNAVYLRDLGNEVVGFDIAGPYLEIARQRGIDVYDVNIESDELPVLPPFDVVIMTEFLEHLIDPIKVLNGPVRQLLKDGGQLVVSTINCGFLRYRITLLCGELPDFGENRVLSGRRYNLHHKTLLTYETFLDLLKTTGFRPVVLEPVAHVGRWSRSIRSVVKRLLQYLNPRLFVSDILAVAVKEAVVPDVVPWRSR
ncbi:MAG: hypothetical protein C3F12_10015 [Candidatus Methylomirabilota bacterium]|nr:class I SAM-dependent methyltransferase [Candidatus Methylomirabilis sp.]NJD69850.1 class I SAM-dependent methyltransferase [candidate division NC10 bacterium]PWB46354.1 MAG: hypothetical protein C3F12_10015 [candidate division NC10 bacterium]